MKRLKTLIIDDDILNIQILQIFLQNYFPMLEKAKEATTVFKGIQAYKKYKPDILLLDIELGSNTIFSFLDAIGPVKGEIIFISSYSKFGIKAVNYNAAGFVLKPINPKVLKKALFKVLTRLNEKLEIQAKIDLAEAQKKQEDYLKMIAI